MKDIAMNECELIPNRVFVGALPFSTTEPELKDYFNKLTGCDNVKEVKIIIDFKGISKGFGFVTFETEAEASTVLNLKSDSLTFKESKLNIAPAFRRIKPYQNNSKYHRNDQTSSMTVQTENIKADRFCMSPNSGKVLNLFTPTLTTMTDAKSETAPDDNQAIDTEKSETDVAMEANDDTNNEGKQNEEEQQGLISTDTNTNVCLKTCTMDKTDHNNNEISTKTDDLDCLKGSQETILLEGETNTSKELVSDETTNLTQLEPISQINQNSKPNHYNKGNQRTYNNNRNKSNGRYQQNVNYNQHLTIQTHGSNYNGNKLSNQFSTGSQSKAYQHHANFNQSYGFNSSIQYYYAMAAAMSGNMYSPKPNSNPMHKQKQTGDSLRTTSVAKSSNDFVGSIMHGSYPNVYANHPAIDQTQQFVPLPSTNYQANGTYQSQQTNAPKSSKTPYGYGTNSFQQPNRQGVSSQGSSNSESTSGYVNSSSTQSASSSSSSVASYTPSTLNQVTVSQQQPVSYSNGNPHVGANNTAVNYVNHIASLNSSALTGPTQQHATNGQEMYSYPINQPYMRPNLNTPVKNGELNASQPATSTDQMGQQSNYNQNQSKPAYYASSLPNSASTIPQPPDAYNNYQKQAVSTISSAFETATNSGSDNNSAINTGQSTENLDELMQNKLTLQTTTEANNNQPLQPQYYYIAQPGYAQNNPVDNAQASQAPLPQYYVYYPPNSTVMAGQHAPHYQYTAQPIPSYIPAQQQGMPLNGAYIQPAPPSTYPIQVNTMNANHLSMPNNSGPHSAPLPQYIPATVNYPQSQQTQYQMVGGVPQIPPPSTQYQQHTAMYPNGQYVDNRMKLQSPNPQGNVSQGAKGPQQMAKYQFYQNHMLQNQPRGAVRQKSFTKSDSISSRP